LAGQLVASEEQAIAVACPGRHDDQQHGERHPRLQHFAGLEAVSPRRRRRRRADRYTAVTQHGLRLPDFEQRE
jgi:hypothetical protein